MTHYFDKTQTSPLREEELRVHIFNQEYTFLSASGLFSKQHLDVATRLLIEKCDLSSATSVLDLGCGWGAVGILLAKKGFTGAITASDVNQRAVDYTKKNARRLHVKNITVVQSDLFASLPELYDCILTNPPYVAGRELCYLFITESYAHLRKGGNLQLVARHSKGGKMLSEKMAEVFGNVSVVAKASGFRIYKSIKS
jgi:16S rRNA G1207 methylase RsmC